MENGVRQKITQREGFGLQGSLAALRAVRARERRVARDAARRDGGQLIDLRRPHGWADSMTKDTRAGLHFHPHPHRRDASLSGGGVMSGIQLKTAIVTAGLVA